MNDNLVKWEGPRHLQATALLNDLMIILSNMAQRGLEAYDENGEPIYCPEFWANECAGVLNIKKPIM